MHCCLAVRAAAKVGDAISASRAFVRALNDRSTAKSTETTQTGCLIHFMVQPLQLKNTGEFGVWSDLSQFVIEVLRLQFRCLL